MPSKATSERSFLGLEGVGCSGVEGPDGDVSDDVEARDDMAVGVQERWPTRLAGWRSTVRLAAPPSTQSGFTKEFHLACSLTSGSLGSQGQPSSEARCPRSRGPPRNGSSPHIRMVRRSRSEIR